jgi:hypothetical protein
MGSNEPLDTASQAAEYGTDSQDYDTIIIDGPNKPFLAPPAGEKRKRGALAEDELMAFTSMTEAVEDVAQAIRENKSTDVHPELYKAVMDVLEYSPDALMAALNHLVDHKAQGITFVAMADSHRSLWLQNYLSKNYFNL